jgi:glycosyltransferase involved in cell wall biosynthesis
MKKRVLIHSLIFSPDGVSTAYLYNDIALAFKNNGWDVVVVSTTPHFNAVPEQVEQQPMRWKVPGLFKVSDFHGIPVYHVPQKKFKSTVLRLLGFLYWHIVSFFLVLSIRKVNVILSPSPPLTIGQLNLWLGSLKGCKVVYNVQEIYPDILGKDSGIAYRVLSRMERRIYAKSDAVTTIDQVFHDTIVGRFKDPSRLHIIPNFVDTDLYRPNVGHMGLDRNLFPETESIRVLYAGNIGFAQDWEPLVELAKKTLGQPIEYFVIGEGVRKDYLEESKQTFGLENLHILPYQPRELMPQILDYSDLQFIFMHPEMDMQGFPSKVYTVMACGRPLLVCSGEGTPIVNFLSGIGCAKLVMDRNLSVKVPQMAEWLSSVTKEELREMGIRGLAVIQGHYSKEIVTGQYVELIDSLMK